MTQRSKVKVIKKGTTRPVVDKQEDLSRTKREAAREMVSTVTTWVSDFQQQKRQQTQLAIEHLFGQQPQSNES
jgi:hypothetical protein